MELLEERRAGCRKRKACWAAACGVEGRGGGILWRPRAQLVIIISLFLVLCYYDMDPCGLKKIE